MEINCMKRPTRRESLMAGMEAVHYFYFYFYFYKKVVLHYYNFGNGQELRGGKKKTIVNGNERVVQMLVWHGKSIEISLPMWLKAGLG